MRWAELDSRTWVDSKGHYIPKSSWSPARKLDQAFEVMRKASSEWGEPFELIYITDHKNSAPYYACLDIHEVSDSNGFEIPICKAAVLYLLTT